MYFLSKVKLKNKTVKKLSAYSENIMNVDVMEKFVVALMYLPCYYFQCTTSLEKICYVQLLIINSFILQSSRKILTETIIHEQCNAQLIISITPSIVYYNRSVYLDCLPCAVTLLTWRLLLKNYVFISVRYRAVNKPCHYHILSHRIVDFC